MVGEPLASVLRSGRDVFNMKFAHARRRFPNLDAAAFSDFLRTTVDPVAREVSLPSQELSNFIQVAYDVALELTGEGLVGADAKARAIENAWRTVLPRLKPSVLAAADTALAATSNAIHNLAKARGCRPDEWIGVMKLAAPHCEDLGQFLRVGQVVAWRSGMAQLRQGALEEARALPENLQRIVLCTPPEVAVGEVLARLNRDVWHNPSGPIDAGPAPLRPVKKVGAFRGLGGDFVRPPIVAAHDGQLFVRSGEDCWLLIADVFGFSLHRAKPEEFEAAQRLSTLPPKLRVTPAVVALDGREATIAMPGEITSVATLDHTIAVTSTFTHSIQLLARQP